MLKFLQLLISIAFFPSIALSGEKTLTYDMAVYRTLASSPTLKAASSEIGEKYGEQIQSGLLPNPVFSYSVENVFGNHHWKGWESAETRYEFMQLIELGDKRHSRMTTADYHLLAQQTGYEVTKRILLNNLSKAFISVVAAQEQLHLAQEMQRIAQEIFNTVSEKVEAGKISLIQKNKSQIDLSSAHITFKKAAIDLEKSKERLSMFWGASYPDFDKASYYFYDITPPVAWEVCLDQLNSNPEIMRAHFELAAAHHNLNLRKAEAIPDVIVRFGYKTLQDTHNKGFILGAALPIPIYDLNQGNIQKARHEEDKWRNRLEELRLLLENILFSAYKDLARTHLEAEYYHKNILKLAEDSFLCAEDGFKEGKFEYQDMLDSQRTYFEIKEKYILILMGYHFHIADIEFLSSER